MPGDWDDDDPDDVEGGLDDDDVDDPDAVDPVVISERALIIAASEQARQRWWSTIQRQHPDGPVEQLFLVRAILTFVAAGGRGYLDREWIPALHERIRLLAANDPPEELLSAAGSLTALVLSITRSTLSRVVDDVDAVHQRSVEHDTRHLVVYADAARITEYSAGLAARFGASVVAADSVLADVARNVNDDPFTDALAAISDLGHDCTVTGTHLEVAASQSYPLAVALTIVSRFERVPVVSVRCPGSDKVSDYLVCWQSPNLLIVHPTPTLKHWGAVYQLRGAGLAALRSGTTAEISHREIESFMAGQPPGETARQVLDACGRSV